MLLRTTMCQAPRSWRWYPSPADHPQQLPRGPAWDRPGQSPPNASITELRRSSGHLVRWRGHQPLVSGPLSGWGFAEDVRRAHDDDLQFIQPGDLETIATPIDFVGLNCCVRNIARSAIVREADNALRAVDPYE
jgi:hypothetical protein